MAKKPEACPVCSQVDEGQTGEHPCSECGLPWIHDERPETVIFVRDLKEDGPIDGVLENLILLEEGIDPDSDLFHIERDSQGNPILLAWFGEPR